MPYLLVRHKVQDYGKWRPAFDEHGATRRAGGGGNSQVFRDANDPSNIVILMEWDSLDNARQFAQSADLRQTMERAGVTDHPDVYFLEEA